MVPLSPDVFVKQCQANVAVAGGGNFVAPYPGPLV